MIKYVVQHKITKCFRIAFQITHISDENEYLKERYNFLASACDVGKFLIVDEETGIHFTMSGNAFNEGYTIVKCIIMYPTIRAMADMRKEKAKEKTTMKTAITVDIKKVIFNDPATIVIWADGTKTVVKCKEGETYSKWAGLALCYAKRINGEKFHAEFKRWCGEDEEAQEETGYSCGSAYSIADSFAEIGKNARTCLDTLAKAFNGDNSIDYRDVIFKNRDDAKRIIDDMKSVVREFGSISLGNYCDMVGAGHKLFDYYIGWTETDKVGILTVKNGYKIILPEPGSIQPTVAADHVKNFDIKSAIDEIKRTK